MYNFDPFGFQHKALMELLNHLHMQLVRVEKKLDEVLEDE
tara:strand:+ start:1101 stop:1220 length:120 start_codon:yes stop_codon:yes gene_type:complete